MTKEKFFERNRNIVNRVVRGRLAKTKRVVHGSRSQNALMPKFLNKKTRDWDVFAKNPRKAAMNMEKALDKKFKGDFFFIKKGKGSAKALVYKVKSTITNEGFVDYAKVDRVVPTVSKRGVNFATLGDQKERALKNVKDPKLKFRRTKDLDLLRRIKIFEKIRGKKF